MNYTFKKQSKSAEFMMGVERSKYISANSITSLRSVISAVSDRHQSKAEDGREEKNKNY